MSKMEDLAGRQFGRLTPIEVTGKENGRHPIWSCLCTCGYFTEVRAGSLKSGHTKSCGCLQREKTAKTGNERRIDLTGKRFGRLTVIKDVNKRRNSGCIVWLCSCDCGNTHKITSSGLRNSKTHSCGCIQKEKASKANFKHGDTVHYQRTRLYETWTGMKQRCTNSNLVSYKYYGGRGIMVCDEWAYDYAPFREWAYANGYDDTLCIDRIDNDGGYYPSNCQLITMSENARKRWEQQRERRV